MKPRLLSLALLFATGALYADPGVPGPSGVGAMDDRDQNEPRWVADWRASRNALVEVDPTLEFDPASLIVQFRPGVDEAAKAAMRALVGGRTLQTWTIAPGLEHVLVEHGVVEKIALLNGIGRATGVVEFAEPDYLYKLVATPNDTYYGLLWGMNNSGQTVNNDPGVAGADIDANLAWDVVTGGTMAVGMADSGIREIHEDLVGNIWTNPGEIPGNNIDDDGNGYKDDTWGWDFWNNDKSPRDDNGHGTHTAGTVGARGNNGKGVTGVCWNVQLVGLKIGSRTGSVSTTAAISAINYCVAKNIRLSNHSWGGGAYSSAMNTAINNARAAGHMMVCAAGNGGSDGVGDNNDGTPFYPASYAQDNIISVAATDNNDGRASFSNYGASSVDLGAPGVNIASTYIQQNKNNVYVWNSGTSMAAPHVTGVAALVWMQNPSWSYSQVRGKILSTARPVSSLSGRCVTGGVLNANNAVR